MADLVRAAGFAGRAADALLRGVGGRVVMLRVPAPGDAGVDAEQLGLVTPEFQDVELGPVVFRKARATVGEGKAARREMLVSAAAVKALVGSLGYSAASVLFANAAGVLMDGVLLGVESATEAEVGGAPYMYRLVLRGPVSLVV
jgi:hypothetical protein